MPMFCRFPWTLYDIPEHHMSFDSDLWMGRMGVARNKERSLCLVRARDGSNIWLYSFRIAE
jgi:hypothetical protein